MKFSNISVNIKLNDNKDKIILWEDMVFNHSSIFLKTNNSYFSE